MRHKLACIVLIALLLICNSGGTREPITSVWIDCPGIMNDIKVCEPCKKEDVNVKAPKGCSVVERTR